MLEPDVLVANLILGREPAYALGQWAAGFDPALLGLGREAWSCSTTTG